MYCLSNNVGISFVLLTIEVNILCVFLLFFFLYLC